MSSSKKHHSQPGLSPWVVVLLVVAAVAIIFARLHLRSFVAATSETKPPAVIPRPAAGKLPAGGAGGAQPEAQPTGGAADTGSPGAAPLNEKDTSPGLLVNMQRPDWSDIHAREETWFVYEIRDALNVRIPGATLTATATRTDGKAPDVVFHPLEYKTGWYGVATTLPAAGKWDILVQAKRGELNLGSRLYHIDVKPPRQKQR